MQKPKNMTRKQYHEVREIIKDFLGPACFIGFNDPATFYEGVVGFESHRTDEGYTATTVEVFPDDNSVDNYIVHVYNEARDCDGRTSHSTSYVMRANKGKRKRWYPSRDYETGRPVGRFGVKTRWRVVKQILDRHRDYTAESMGY